MADQLKELAEIPRDFLKDGTQFLNRCTKRECALDQPTSIVVNDQMRFTSRSELSGLVQVASIARRDAAHDRSSQVSTAMRAVAIQ